MEQLNKLKRKSLGSLSFLILMMAAIGIFGILSSNLFASEPEAQNLYDIPRDQLEGSYVTVDVEWIYGCYAYTETYEDNKPTGIITEQEYIIDANELDFICLILDQDNMGQADALLAECDAWYMGETDIITKGFTITGEVKALPTDSMELYHEFIAYDSMSAEDQAVFLPLYIAPVSYDLEIVPLVFGLLFVGLALFLLITVLSGNYQKQLRQKLEQMFGENTERADEFLRQMLESPAANHMHIYNGCILLNQSCSQVLLDTNDLVWAYKQTVRNKLYGFIPMGKTYRIILKTSDKKEFFAVMNEKQIKENLIRIAQQFPSCAIGYSDQMQSVYTKDPAAMRQIAAAQRTKSQN